MGLDTVVRYAHLNPKALVCCLIIWLPLATEVSHGRFVAMLVANVVSPAFSPKAKLRKEHALISNSILVRSFNAVAKFIFLTNI
jgi:hypothetical protein